MLFLPPLGGRLVDRLGWRLPFALALAILAAGNATIALALISDGSAPPLIPTFCGIAAIGGGVALAHPQLFGATVSLVPPDLAGLASAVTVIMRQAGFGCIKKVAAPGMSENVGIFAQRVISLQQQLRRSRSKVDVNFVVSPDLLARGRYRRVETAGGGSGLVTALFSRRLYIVAAVAE
jgi:hypothetical protein